MNTFRNFLLLARFFRNLGLCVLCVFSVVFSFPSLVCWIFFLVWGPEFCYAAWMLDLIMPLADCFQFNADGHTIRWTRILRNSCLCSSLISLCVCFFPSLWRSLFFFQQQPTEKCKSTVQCDILSWMVEDAFQILFTCVMPSNFDEILCFVVDFTIFPSARQNDKLLREISGENPRGQKKVLNNKVWVFPWISLSYGQFQRCILHFKLPICVDKWMHKLSFETATDAFLEKCVQSVCVCITNCHHK